MISTGQRVKIKENKKDRQMFGSFQRAKRNVGHEDDSDTNCSWSTWNSCQSPGKETEGVENQDLITAWLKSARILWRVVENCKEDLLLLRLQRKTTRRKIKEGKKLVKYLGRARELKKLQWWGIPIVVGALGMVIKGSDRA